MNAGYVLRTLPHIDIKDKCVADVIGFIQCVIVRNTINESLHEEVIKVLLKANRFNNIKNHATISTEVYDGPVLVQMHVTRYYHVNYA